MLRRMLLAIAVLGAITAAITPTAVTASHSAGGARADFADGGGISAVGTRFGFNAHNTPTGTDPFGHAVFHSTTLSGPLMDRRGHVVCLNVQGNRAIFGVEDEQPNGMIQFLEFLVEDEGEPVNGQAVDRLTALAPVPPRTTAQRPPSNCRNVFPPPNTGFVLREGNITVHDGPTA